MKAYGKRKNMIISIYSEKIFFKIKYAFIIKNYQQTKNKNEKKAYWLCKEHFQQPSANIVLNDRRLNVSVNKGYMFSLFYSISYWNLATIIKKEGKPYRFERNK